MPILKNNYRILFFYFKMITKKKWDFVFWNFQNEYNFLHHLNIYILIYRYHINNRRSIFASLEIANNLIFLLQDDY